MYDKILNDPVVFPPHLSEPAQDLLSKLIDRDVRLFMPSRFVLKLQYFTILYAVW